VEYSVRATIIRSIVQNKVYEEVRLLDLPTYSRGRGARRRLRLFRVSWWISQFRALANHQATQQLLTQNNTRKMKPTTDSEGEIKTTALTNADSGHGFSDTEEQKKATASVVASEIILKIPPLTPIYWCEKMTATTFGETFADWFTQTLDYGYTYTSIVLIAVFFIFLGFQLKVKSYWPVLFWFVMASSSVAGTCVSDFIDRTLEWGYPLGMSVLLSILLFIVGCWKCSGEHMNVAGHMTRKAEAFFWSTILVSNTLGTAMGDFLADSLELGFGLTAGIIGSMLVICALLAYFSKVSHVILFWVAFVLTRPFGATFGDLLTKGSEKGGLDLGTLNASLVIFALFVVCFAYEMYTIHETKKVKEVELEQSKTEEDKIKMAVDNMTHEHHDPETEADFFP
jgi:uncharacterized membrane-anchored protein